MLDLCSLSRQLQTFEKAISLLTDPDRKVSCHFIIDVDGKIFNIVDLENRAWHAGESKWKNFTNLNRYSIGIELVNMGYEFGYQKFSNIQIKSLITLCKYLKRKYKIKDEYFLGHSDIAPLRKVDPGENFPWQRLSKYNLGLWYKENLQNIKLDQNQLE